MSKIIEIAGVEVRQDDAGRYSLNDLHRAAGKEDRHKPGNWTALDQTQALIAEIEIAGISAIQSKQGLGTFVAKELVYAYAMWISPAFHLKVIRTFDAVVMGQVPTQMTRMQILQLAMESEQGRIQAEAERDHAIATKAQIGSRREATAMATAAKAKREADRLRDQLGFSSRHATVMQVEDAMGESYPWLPLRKWCQEHGVTAEMVPDKRFPNGVKAWPAGAWMAAYGIDIGELFGEVPVVPRLSRPAKVIQLGVF